MPVEECRIDVLDRGFLFGDAVYEVVPVYNGRMFGWRAHFERLQRSLAELGIGVAHTRGEWEAIFDQLIQRFDAENLYLYLQISRGVAPRSHIPQKDMIPTVFAMAVPEDPLPREFFEKGIAVVTGEDFRWGRCDIKTTNLLANVMLKMHAVNEGVDDVILLRDGVVTESTSANVFIAKDGVVMTTPLSSHILPGVTRNILIDLAKQHEVKVKECEITATQLKVAEEIWLSSSTREIVAVTRLDEKPVGEGIPGPLWQTFRNYIKVFSEALAS